MNEITDDDVRNAIPSMFDEVEKNEKESTAIKLSDHYEDFIGKKIGLIGENYNYTGTLAEVGQENLKLESGNRYDRAEEKVIHFATWYLNKDKIESFGDPW